MLNHPKMQGRCRAAVHDPYGLRSLVALALMLVLSQSACSKKGKVVFSPPSIARVAFLPLNLPEDQKDLQWTALAAPILLARVCENAPDLQAVPFWESMPVAVESAGASRIFTDESAAAAASWVSADWAVMGDISHARRNRVSLIADFIPAKGSQIPFRYMRTARIETMADGFPKAFREFLRYLTVRPLERKRSVDLQLSSMKTVAEALDREYGWFVEAEPGKAREIVQDLMHRDERLARLLFNPETYPQLNNK